MYYTVQYCTERFSTHLNHGDDNMLKIIKGITGCLLVIGLTNPVFAADGPKVAVIAFELNDMTGIPNAKEELERVELLSSKFVENLKAKGINVVPQGSKVKDEIDRHSPTYLYDNIETAIELNKDSDADYLLVGVAFKPTYLFVYPRLIMVDVKQHKVVMSKVAQLESSWSDQNTTIRTAEKMAQMVKERVDGFADTAKK